MVRIIQGALRIPRIRSSYLHLRSLRPRNSYLPVLAIRFNTSSHSSIQSSSINNDAEVADSLQIEKEESRKFTSDHEISVAQLKKLIEEPLAQLESRIRAKSFDAPYSSLNKLEGKETARIMATFTKRLHWELNDYFQENSKKEELKRKEVQDITLIDYMNPQICNIVATVYSIQQQNYPSEFLEFYNISSEQEFLVSIMTKLLYKEYIRLKIKETRPESEMVDLSNPAEWFPEARKMKRKIIMHVGPTNSGKTYNSLQTLRNAKSGYYAGPLRLLAREIYERFNDEDVRCNLITGEEVIPSINEFGKVSEISSGTIEMIPLHKKMDICIIDEIQMISDEHRGAAWTNAVLGVLAKEIHLCGEESAVPLIEKITKITGDELSVKRYERLGKLTVLPKALQDVKNLQRGDCLIAFSKRKILELKCKIEQSSKLKVGIIYGALPPEIRSQEANGFNEGKYDVLVASDAVGMGLNLRIKRIIFHGVKKFNGNEMKSLSVSAVKQIAGRAGRFSKDKGESEGFVTAYMKKDLDFIKTMMESPTKDLKKACIWPTDLVWKHYMAKFPKEVPFHQILKHFEAETSSLNMKNYFISELDARNEMLKLFLREDLYKRTTIEDQLVLSLAPINVQMNSPEVIETAFKFLRNITECTTSNIFDFDFLHEAIIRRTPKINTTIPDTVETLRLLEDNHRVVLLFLWLSQRWPTLFVDKEGAMDIKSLIEKRISQELNNLRRLNKQ